MTTSICEFAFIDLINGDGTFILNNTCPNIIGSMDYGDFDYFAVPDTNEIIFNFRRNATTKDDTLTFMATVTYSRDPLSYGTIIDVSYDATNQSQMNIKWGKGTINIQVQYNSPNYNFLYNMNFGINTEITTLTIEPIQVIIIQHSSTPINNTNNITNNINILITADFSQIIYDVSEVRYLVTYDELYTGGLGCYNGFTQHLTQTQTLFYLVPQNIGNAIVGNDSLTLIQKILDTPFLSNIGPLTGYALLKMILGRVLFGKFDAKWMYRKYYKKLIVSVLNSPYKIFYDVYLGPNKSYEQYFKYKRDSPLYD